MARAPALPAGATDAHVHVFDPKRFPYADGVAYRPQPHEVGTADDLATTLASHGVDRVVIVNPTSGYADDLDCMLDAVARLGDRARGVARGPLDVVRHRPEAFGSGAAWRASASISSRPASAAR